MGRGFMLSYFLNLAFQSLISLSCLFFSLSLPPPSSPLKKNTFQVFEEEEKDLSITLEKFSRTAQRGFSFGLLAKQR